MIFVALDDYVSVVAYFDVCVDGCMFVLRGGWNRLMCVCSCPPLFRDPS